MTKVRGFQKHYWKKKKKSWFAQTHSFAGTCCIGCCADCVGCCADCAGCCAGCCADCAGCVDCAGCSIGCCFLEFFFSF